MTLPKVGSLWRGIVAFAVTYLVAVLIGAVGLSYFFAEPWEKGGLFTNTLFCTVFMAPLALPIFLLISPLRATVYPRPYADVVIWMFSFLALTFLFWGPVFLVGFGMESTPVTTTEYVGIGAVGAFLGWLYWLLAGRPTRHQIDQQD